jgi:hypothetical protein
LLHRGNRDVGQRRRTALPPGASPPARAKGEGKQPIQAWVERAVSPRTRQGPAELVEDLIFADDDGIPPDRDGYGVTNRAFVGLQNAARREPFGVDYFVGLEHRVSLDAVAGFEDEPTVSGGPIPDA